MRKTERTEGGSRRSLCFFMESQDCSGNERVGQGLGVAETSTHSWWEKRCGLATKRHFKVRWELKDPWGNQKRGLKERVGQP